MNFINEINDILWTYILIIMLLGCAVWFSIRTRFVQFRMLREMIILLSESAGKGKQGEKHVSSFQAFDITIASLARFFAGKNYAPTISLDVKFIRPVKMGDRMLVTAKAVATGRRITQLTCEAYSEQTGKLVASGASVYMNVDTTKEHQNSEQDPSDQ